MKQAGRLGPVGAPGGPAEQARQRRWLAGPGPQAGQDILREPGATGRVRRADPQRYKSRRWATGGQYPASGLQSAPATRLADFDGQSRSPGAASRTAGAPSRLRPPRPGVQRVHLVPAVSIALCEADPEACDRQVRKNPPSRSGWSDVRTFPQPKAVRAGACAPAVQAVAFARTAARRAPVAVDHHRAGQPQCRDDRRVRGRAVRTLPRPPGPTRPPPLHGGGSVGCLSASGNGKDPGGPSI